MQTANLDLTTGLQCGGETEVSACGMPSINYATDNAAFVWQDCNTGEWSARFSAASRFTLYEGTVTSDQGFTQVSGVDLEGTDTLDVSSNEVFYNLRIGAGFDDGFDFSTPAGSNGCFDLQLPAGSPVLIGQNRTPIATPFDLETLGACSAIP